MEFRLNTEMNDNTFVKGFPRHFHQINTTFHEITIILISKCCSFSPQTQATMAIQCGLCNNIMPSSSFLTHKERKHSMVVRVPYVKLPDDVLKRDSTEKQMVKCRFCPNRVPEDTMERHLQRCHITCHLCSKTLLKSSYEKHMQQKHGGNFMRTKDLSQSKASVQSDVSTTESLAENDPPPVPFRPPPFSTVSSMIQDTSDNSDVIRVNEWELCKYIRQGRVYTKDGCLYLRNVNAY